MSKKFGKSVIAELQRIRYVLDNMENCEDGEEMIHIAQEISADVESLEQVVEEKFKL
jgi:predicted RNA-binding protein with EMAP domain